MKFSGRQLKDLGVPQDRIKYFVDKEYDSPEVLLRAVAEFRVTPAKSDEEKVIDRIVREDMDCAFQVLWELQVFPWSPQSNSTTPSKRELRQWLDDGAVRINGKFPRAHESVEFPITDLVYFSGAARQTTSV
ncbi:hypothetical protein [Gemmata sp.]|uniref:hypothetical protein n=1 Tax=Gemmata sp. TaxID=1914242 RepID=UPI003F71F8F9